MRKLIVSLVLFIALGLQAQELDSKVFSLLNLDYPGLEKVKSAHQSGNNKLAAEALLDYYRNRTSVVMPDLDITKVSLSKEEKKWAEESLEHKFFAHKGYQPSYSYGKDIDWTYWPVKDNELRWQLHRHKWFSPLGKSYRLTGDEKYVQAWIEHLTDWINKNPYPTKKNKRKSIGTVSSGVVEKDLKFDEENARFSWRPLETSERINKSPEQFLLFLPAKSFTPEFLTQYLCNVHLHGQHIVNNFSDKGNHLLFEAQRVLQTGIFFPELNDSKMWREVGISILNKEMGVQVYDDGMQFELDPHYHLAAINIFFKALQVADANGYRSEFPQLYINTIEKMIEVTINMMFPDYSEPIFSDNRRSSKGVMVRYFKDWLKVYPNNQQIRYFATDGKEGQLPSYTSNAFKTSGFYMLRNGWNMASTAMVLKAGPPAFWHNQPDNGTFDLFFKGRNFFFDSGCYVYGGDAEVEKQRAWFRQTMIHKTLTLNNKDLEKTDSKCLLWKIGEPTEILTVENPSYEGLTHRRTVFFVDKTYFVILDEAIGNAKGKVGIHFQMGEDNVKTTPKENKAYTVYPDNNNVILKTFSPQRLAFEQEEGWISYDYRKKFERAAFSFNVEKKDDATVRFVTIIYPVSNGEETLNMAAKIVKADASGAILEVTVGKEKRRLEYSIPNFSKGGVEGSK